MMTPAALVAHGGARSWQILASAAVIMLLAYLILGRGPWDGMR